MRRLNWKFLAVFSSFHAAAALGFWHFSWPALGIAALFHVLFAWIGIGVCYHRLLAHRGYAVPKPVEYVLATLGALAIQGGPISWVATHIQHHARSDQEGDPHSPKKKGFWWAHLGWMVFDGQAPYRFRAVLEMKRDRYYRFLEAGQLLFQIPLGVLLWAWGGWSFVIYGVFVRTVFSWHATFLVNSATHLWGYRNYRTADDSRNSWWVALLTGGEGWHNNHHDDPRVAKTRVRWWEIDLNWYPIWLMKKLRLARAVIVTRRPARGTKSELAS